jgi:hypothetical protein
MFTVIIALCIDKLPCGALFRVVRGLGVDFLEERNARRLRYDEVAVPRA